MSFAKVMIYGNLTREPELRATTGGTSVAGFGVATNRKWKDANGEQREEATFIDCDAWGKTAEIMCEYLKKGDPVFINGRLQLDQWQDEDGNNRSKLKVVVESFDFVAGRDGGGGSSAPKQKKTYKGNASKRTPNYTPPPKIHDNDDIPF